MKSNRTDGEVLSSYLLGELPEPEADRLEQRLLEEDELFELCEAMEADLLAACDRGDLAPAQREHVLRRLTCSPGGRERLAFARSLNAAADETTQATRETAPVLPFFRRPAAPRQPRTHWAALAAAALLAVAGLFWFSWEQLQEAGTGHRITQEISAPAIRSRPPAAQRVEPPAVETPAAEDRRESDRLARKEEPVSPTSPPRAEPVKEVLVLSLLTTRGAPGVGELRIPSSTEVVEIQLDVEGLEDLGPFHIEVRDRQNNIVSDLGRLEPRRLDWTVAALVLELPAELLPGGRYEVAVTAQAGEELSQEFEVIRENP